MESPIPARGHQRGFNCIDRARVKILLLAVFLLHGSYKTHDESGTGDGCIEVGHTSCEGAAFFAFLIVFVKFVDKWHPGNSRNRKLPVLPGLLPHTE